MVRGTQKYKKNHGICKAYVTGEECCCDWAVFCQNAYDLFGVGFADMLYECDTEEEIKDLVHKII